MKKKIFQLVIFLTFCLYANAQSELKFNETEHDFGRINVNKTEKVECKFRFSNVSEDAIRIIGCSAAFSPLECSNYTKVSIAPGGTGEISVTFFCGLSTTLDNISSKKIIRVKYVNERTQEEKNEKLYVIYTPYREGEPPAEWFKTKKTKMTGSDGYVWYLVEQNRLRYKYLSAVDMNGKEIIESRLTIDSIVYQPQKEEKNREYCWPKEYGSGFQVYYQGNCSYYNKKGENIIPDSRQYISVTKVNDKDLGTIYICHTDTNTIYCDASGNEKVNILGVYHTVPQFSNGRFFIVTDFSVLKFFNMSEKGGTPAIILTLVQNALTPELKKEDLKTVYGLVDGNGNHSKIINERPIDKSEIIDGKIEGFVITTTQNPFANNPITR